MLHFLPESVLAKTGHSKQVFWINEARGRKLGNEYQEIKPDILCFLLDHLVEYMKVNAIYG